MKLFVIAFILVLMSPNTLAAVILQYHHVSNNTPASTSISSDLFKRHMMWIEESGFRVISLVELIERLRSGTSIPHDAVVITFDDAYVDIYPAIEQYLNPRNWPSTVFVAPQLIELNTRGYLSWEQLRELQAMNVDIANHSWAHGHLAERYVGEGLSDWRRRISASIDDAEVLLTERVNQNLKIVAYPYGEYSDDLKKILEERSFAAVGQQSGAVGPYSDLLALPRFPMGGNYGQETDFKMKLNSLAMPIRDRALSDDKGRPQSNIIKHDQGWPVMRLSLAEGKYPRVSQMTCFATGIGAIDVVEIDNRTFTTQGTGIMPLGRSRYNCTAPSLTNGRYYWYSQSFVHLDKGNVWPPEPK